MIAIGTDIIEIERVHALWLRQGSRFSRRILTPAELAVFETKREPWRYLAKGFAAKEAVAKCFGTGIGRNLSWQDIEIHRDESGAPRVRLTERARELAETRGASGVLLSLSDERHYAVAFAVLVA